MCPHAHFSLTQSHICLKNVTTLSVLFVVRFLVPGSSKTRNTEQRNNGIIEYYSLNIILLFMLSIAFIRSTSYSNSAERSSGHSLNRMQTKLSTLEQTI